MPPASRQVFRTHSNYISAIRYVASGGITEDRNTALKLLASKVLDSGCLKNASKARFDIASVHKSLNNAWGIEALLKMEDHFVREDDLIRLSNNWFVVQSYYIIYYITQTLAISEGYPKPETHAQVQRFFLQFWSKQPWILIPWCISYNEDGFHNLPYGIFVDDHVHSWKKVDDETALSLYCKALRTTREEFVEEALNKRRKKQVGKSSSKIVRLSENQKKQTQARVRPTTLISYLYRLKRRTSYEQTSILAVGPENIYQSKEIRENFVFIVESTLLIAEMIIARVIGKEHFYSWCKDWEKYKSPALDYTGPGDRLNLIQL